jgi:multiple sugar transport system substrate-binding protein
MQDFRPVMEYSLTNSVPYATVPTWQQVATTFSKEAVTTYNGQGSVDDLLSRTQAQGGS